MSCSKQAPNGISDDDSSCGNMGYRDYFHESASNVALSLPRPKKRGPRGGVMIPFPVKLYNMLCSVEEDNLQHLVSWEPHGRSFTIIKPEAFESDVVPRFFNQTKLSSFRRQLNLYGFRQALLAPMDHGMTYYHELFLRGRPDLAKFMQRTGAARNQSKASKSNKKAGGSTKPSESKSVQEDPDFAAMPICSDKTNAQPQGIVNPMIRSESTPMIRSESAGEVQACLPQSPSTPVPSEQVVTVPISHDVQVVSSNMNIITPVTVSTLVDDLDFELPLVCSNKEPDLGCEESDLLQAPRIPSPNMFSSVFEHLIYEPDTTREAEDPLKFLSEYFGPEPILG